MPIQAQ